MTTPPHKLIACVPIDSEMTICGHDSRPIGKMPYTLAMEMAARGAIEGVGPRIGVVKYLRWLKPEAIEEDPTIHFHGESASEVERPHPMNAVTNLGAYRQHLEHGFAWSLCLCRKLDGARA